MLTFLIGNQRARPGCSSCVTFRSDELHAPIRCVAARLPDRIDWVEAARAAAG